MYSDQLLSSMDALPVTKGGGPYRWGPPRHLQSQDKHADVIIGIGGENDVDCALCFELRHLGAQHKRGTLTPAPSREG